MVPPVVVPPNGGDIVLTGLDVDVTLNVADASSYVVLRYFLLTRGRYVLEVCNMDQFASISDSEILLVPHIPAQAHPWNNEYTVSITTQYTEHGSIRTGTYGRRLRTPLTVPGLGLPMSPETGILTGSAAVYYVGINAGTLTADERLRIQVEHNVQDDLLIFRLIDMQDGGRKGAMVPVTQNGEFILPGFAGSAVSTLEITVDNYAALKAMVVNDYDGQAGGCAGCEDGVRGEARRQGHGVS